MMTAPAPAVAVQIPTSKTLLLQSLKIMKKEPSATQWKKSTKLSSKTTAKLSTSAKRIQKELAEITLNPLLTAVLMYRGEAVEDFTGPDCCFVNFKKGDPVYVYYKLAEVSPELWAGSVGRMFGYFPKDFIKVVREYTKEELQIPTDETDFVCFDVGGDDFDNYNVEELLGFLELYDSANEDSEKAIEKVGQFPEVSQDVEPEPKPVVANSQQIESAFSENTVDLEEQFLAQKSHPHADSQTDNAQGEQTLFELFEEILPDKLKMPESEKNKTSNISQVSNEQEKTDAYKLLKKEINPYLETKENKQEMSIIWKILKKTETTAKRVDISQVSNEQEKTDAYKLLKKEINPYLETKENKQ
ncbi:transport and Golgi organization protein 1 homolog isoform X4 [Ictidomys tridecemlineatus]